MPDRVLNVKTNSSLVIDDLIGNHVQSGHTPANKAEIAG